MLEIVVYTDGACANNPGEGGWGFVGECNFDGQVHRMKKCGYFPAETEVTKEAAALLQKGKTRKPTQRNGRWYIETTNNRMEFMAVIEALKTIKKRQDTKVKIISDSQLVINILGGKWKAKDNFDLINEAKQLMAEYAEVAFEWVKGHAQNDNNIKADELAVEAIKNKYAEPRFMRWIEGQDES